MLLFYAFNELWYAPCIVYGLLIMLIEERREIGVVSFVNFSVLFIVIR